MVNTVLKDFGGVDNRHDLASGFFQPSKDGVFLSSLTNAFITDDKRIRLFPTPDVVANTGQLGTNFKSLFSSDLGLLAQKGDALVLDPHDNEFELVVDIDSDYHISFLEHQGQLFWTDGTKNGRITPEGDVLPWGLPQAPTPTVTAIGGNLPAGTYLVNLTWLDESGTQSGSGVSTTVSVDENSAISIETPVFPEGALKARVWCSETNGSMPMFVGDYLFPQFPALIADVPTSAIPLRTNGMHPLPAGDGLTSRGGYIFTWKDNILSFSAGTWTHLYDPTVHFFQLPSTILGAVGLENGVWVTTTTGMYWLAGSDPMQAQVIDRTDARSYAKGGIRLPAEFSSVEAKQPVALFASDEGLVIGTSDGQLVAPQRGAQKWTVTNKRASFAFNEYDGQNLLFIGGLD